MWQRRTTLRRVGPESELSPAGLHHKLKSQNLVLTIGTYGLITIMANQYYRRPEPRNKISIRIQAFSEAEKPVF
ncbi:hypothetical protein [Halobacillus halophilus]|uniref:hypothetical protein n=1 Tax=Halobacillus halophilus TaxID=1570 RepID=UPI00166FF320|nr:hypothetical protein [Halobacillus halophilus]